MAQPNPKAWSVEDYFLFEEQETTKYEYLDGLVYALHANDIEAMAGASEAHILITGNIFAQLHSALDGQKCRAYQSDMRVQATDTTFFYPDVVAVCGERNFRDENRTTLNNPTAVFEVLSPSTENYDRGKNLSLIVSVHHSKPVCLSHKTANVSNITSVKLMIHGCYVNTQKGRRKRRYSYLHWG